MSLFCTDVYFVRYTPIGFDCFPQVYVSCSL